MKPIALLLTSLALILFASCNSDEPEEKYSVYETEWVETEPVNQFTEMWRFPAELFYLFDNNGIKYSHEHYLKECTYDAGKSVREKYVLYLGLNSARLTIEKNGTISRGIYNRDYNEYTIQGGKYELTNLIPQLAQYPGKKTLEIESDGIYLMVDDADNEFQNRIKIESLKNFKYIFQPITGDTRFEDIAQEGEVYEGKFTANTDPSGVVALNNNDYVFNFTPATRRLVMIRPEHKDIGELDLIK